MAQTDNELTGSASQPNVILPLAQSYTTRNIAGFTSTVVDALDQRKVNCIYEPVKNSVTEKVTIYLSKRPGFTIDAASYGVTNQVGYLVEEAVGGATSWIFSTNGDDIRASSDVTTTVIATAAGYTPYYVDKAVDDTLVVQLRNATFLQRVFTSTAIGTFTEITDTDFTGLVHRGKMEHLHGYPFIMTSNNRIYNGDLASFSAWSPTSYLSKQITQDIARGLARWGEQIIAFGANTMEVFFDNGNPTGSPLIADARRFQRVGLHDTQVANVRHYYTNLGKHMYWRGAHPDGFYAYDGEKVEKVSTPAIDKILAERVTYSIHPAPFRGISGVILALDIPTATTQRWLLFVPEWNDWFEGSSTVIMPVTGQRSGLKWMGVGANQHRLYDMAIGANTWQDNGTNYTMTVQFKIPRSGNHIKRMPMFGVAGDTARSASNLGVSFSDDDGQSWSTARNIDMTSMNKAIHACGAFRDRDIRLTHTANLDCRLELALARII